MYAAPRRTKPPRASQQGRTHAAMAWRHQPYARLPSGARAHAREGHYLRARTRSRLPAPLELGRPGSTAPHVVRIAQIWRQLAESDIVVGLEFDNRETQHLEIGRRRCCEIPFGSAPPRGGGRLAAAGDCSERTTRRSGARSRPAVDAATATVAKHKPASRVSRGKSDRQLSAGASRPRGRSKRFRRTRI